MVEQCYWSKSSLLMNEFSIQLKKGGGYWLYVKLSVQEYSEGKVSSIVHQHYFLLLV